MNARQESKNPAGFRMPAGVLVFLRIFRSGGCCPLEQCQVAGVQSAVRAEVGGTPVRERRVRQTEQPVPQQQHIVLQEKEKNQ